MTTNNCLSEVSLSLTHEESRENSCSFTSRKVLRSFLRTTRKKRQEDNGLSLRVIFLQLVSKQSHFKSFKKPQKKERRDYHVPSLLTTIERSLLK